MSKDLEFAQAVREWLRDNHIPYSVSPEFAIWAGEKLGRPTPQWGMKKADIVELDEIMKDELNVYYEHQRLQALWNFKKAMVTLAKTGERKGWPVRTESQAFALVFVRAYGRPLDSWDKPEEWPENALTNFIYDANQISTDEVYFWSAREYFVFIMAKHIKGSTKT